MPTLASFISRSSRAGCAELLQMLKIGAWRVPWALLFTSAPSVINTRSNLAAFVKGNVDRVISVFEQRRLKGRGFQKTNYFKHFISWFLLLTQKRLLINHFEYYTQKKEFYVHLSLQIRNLKTDQMLLGRKSVHF